MTANLLAAATAATRRASSAIRRRSARRRTPPIASSWRQTTTEHNGTRIANQRESAAPKSRSGREMREWLSWPCETSRATVTAHKAGTSKPATPAPLTRRAWLRLVSIQDIVALPLVAGPLAPCACRPRPLWGVDADDVRAAASGPRSGLFGGLDRRRKGGRVWGSPSAAPALTIAGRSCPRRTPRRLAGLALCGEQEEDRPR